MIQKASPANPYDARIYEIFVVPKLDWSVIGCQEVYENAIGFGSIVVGVNETLYPDDYRELENATVTLQTTYDLPVGFDVKKYLTRWIQCMQVVRAKYFHAFLSVRPESFKGYPKRYMYDGEHKKLMTDTPPIGCPYPLKDEPSDWFGEMDALAKKAKRTLGDSNVPLVLQDIRELLGKEETKEANNERR